MASIFTFSIDIYSHLATFSHTETFSHLRVPQPCLVHFKFMSIDIRIGIIFTLGHFYDVVHDNHPFMA